MSFVHAYSGKAANGQVVGGGATTDMLTPQEQNNQTVHIIEEIS